MIVVLLILALVLSLLIFSRLSADIILFLALLLLILTGQLTPEAALAGFAHPVLFTIAGLYVVAAALKTTGAMQWLGGMLFGHPKWPMGATARLIFPTALLSGLLNNTAVVAMLIPVVQDWSKRIGMSASQFLLPLSYAAIMGGCLTLLGTSTNLLVAGMAAELDLLLWIFEPAKIAVPLLLLGGLFLVLAGHRLLPNNGRLEEALDADRQYRVAFSVLDTGGLTGKTIAEAGLRNLPYGYLADIERNGHLMAAVPPDTVLVAGDILNFVGAPECATDLRRLRGLAPTGGDVRKLATPHHRRCLAEVVVGPDFPRLNQTVRESAFRSQYNAVVLSVSRQGQKIPGKIGDIQLRIGDTLLLETSFDFVEQYQFRKDFMLVSALNDSTPPDHSRAPLALAVLACLVAASAMGIVPIVTAALTGAAAMVALRCLSPSQARRSIDLSVLLVIGASLALGVALTQSGATQMLALTMGQVAQGNAWLTLALLYLVTVLLTELITNNAAAILLFPVATSLAEQLGVSVMPFVMTLMMGASASFLSPLGYQTNLMVQGPGGYHTRDYLRLGAPLSLLVAAVVIGLAPVIWPF